MKKRIFAILVAVMLVGCLANTVDASYYDDYYDDYYDRYYDDYYSRYSSSRYSDWFDISRINAIDVEENLRYEASREEVALLIADICDSHEALPSNATLNFSDDRDFMSSKSRKTIEELSATGIVCGYPDGSFGPDFDVTRAEAVTMILRMVDYLSIDTVSYRRGSSFTDMYGHWAEVYVDRAFEQGIVSGRGNGRFDPNSEITREEVITMLINLMGESNNPLISAIDAVYGLVFENQTVDSRYDDDDRYYDSRYDDDYEDLIERPVVNTGSSNSSSSSSSSNSNINSERPERPVVDLTTSNGNSSSTVVSNGSKPTRPTVDLSTSNNNTNVSTSVDTNETVNERPARPTV